MPTDLPPAAPRLAWFAVWMPLPLWVIAAVGVGCNSQAKSPDITPTLREFASKLGDEALPEPVLSPQHDMVWLREPVDDLADGAWTSQFNGDSGDVVKLNRDGTCKYWWYSCVTFDRDKQPYVGSWTWNGPVLELDLPGYHFRGVRWYAYRHKGELALLPESARQMSLKDGKSHKDCLHFRVPDFDDSDPFAGQRARWEANPDATLWNEE